MADSTVPVVHIAVAFHGGRGHTARLAESVHAGAGGVPGTASTLVMVDDIDPTQWTLLDSADAIIFGAPTYMGTASSSFH
jgi:NAD(P)H dehydrogenase (quinone)